jgi:CRP/FNR family cyclic AMP-dependent transcriptional regulator
MHWPLLHGLTPSQLDEVLSLARRRTHARGTSVLREGAGPHSTHLVIHGHFALRLHAATGEFSTLRIYGPGSSFGRVPLHERVADRVASVVALEDGATWELRPDQVAALRATYPSVRKSLVAVLSEDLQRVTRYMLEVLYVHADARVRRRLLELAPTCARDDGRILIPLTQDDLASLARTSRGTANRVLREEHAAGTLVPRRGAIELVEAGALRRRAEPRAHA